MWSPQPTPLSHNMLAVGNHRGGRMGSPHPRNQQMLCADQDGFCWQRSWLFDSDLSVHTSSHSHRQKFQLGLHSRRHKETALFLISLIEKHFISACRRLLFLILWYPLPHLSVRAPTFTWVLISPMLMAQSATVKKRKKLLGGRRQLKLTVLLTPGTGLEVSLWPKLVQCKGSPGWKTHGNMAQSQKPTSKDVPPGASGIYPASTKETLIKQRHGRSLGTLGKPLDQVHDLWIFGFLSPSIPIRDSLIAFSDISNASARRKYT